jgi:hypothetical protein
MSGAWHIETLADGTGVIEHRAAPRFRALWTTGLEDLAALSGPCWTDEGQGEEDAITLHALRWTDPADPLPGQFAFEALMRAAVLQIDAWIARRL